MDLFTKKRFAVLSISVLVFLNLFLLGILWYTQLRKPLLPPPPEHRPRDTAGFLERELNLLEDQRQKFNLIKLEHSRRSRAVREDIHRLKEAILNEAFNASPDTLKVRKLAREIGEKETEFELFLFQHFSELKSVCTPEQLEILKKIFDEILDRYRHPAPPPGKAPPPVH